MTTVKDWLSYEQHRNKEHADLYARILQLAFAGDPTTKDIAVLVGHHVGFQFGGDIETENEIPSADTLIFDHDIMQRVFGSQYLAIMADLATIPCDLRDHRLRHHLELRYGTVVLSKPKAVQQPEAGGYVLQPY